MFILEYLLVVTLAGLIGIQLINVVKSRSQQRHLEATFYKLLEAHNGCISLIQLAVAARVEAKLAQAYLQRQAQFFAASLEVDEDGDTFYRFPKLRPAQPPQLMSKPHTFN